MRGVGRWLSPKSQFPLPPKAAPADCGLEVPRVLGGGRRIGSKDTNFKAALRSKGKGVSVAQRLPPPVRRSLLPRPVQAPPLRLPALFSLQCKFQRDKLLINSLEEKSVSFFLLFFICFYFCMAPSYALGSLAAQQFSLYLIS